MTPGNHGKRSIVMDILRKTGAAILAAFLLTAGISYAQETALEHYSSGLEYGIKEEFEKARTEFKKALEIDPLDVHAKEALKVVNDATNESLRDFDLKIRQDSAALLFEGITYANRGENDKAISSYNRAIEVYPGFAEAFNHRGVAYENIGQYDLAISDYESAIEINPRYVIAYFNRGTIYRLRRQYDQAVSDYSNAILYNPRYGQAYDNRGYLYMVRFKDRKRGCRDWKRACELGVCASYNHAREIGDCE